MLGFLRRIWSRDQRLLFSFHDGTRKRWADPVAVATAVERACPKWAELFDTIRHDPAGLPDGGVRDDLIRQQQEARPKLLAAVRAGFGVEPFNDSDGKPRGLTEQETVALFHTFLAWFFSAAEDAAPFAGWRNADAASRPASPTASSAASGSTET